MNQAFIDACNVVMPFGQFKGQRLSQIAGSDRGLSYLDFISDLILDCSPIKQSILLVLAHPAAAAQVEATIEY